MLSFIPYPIKLFFLDWGPIDWLVFRTILATLTSFLISIICGPWIISRLSLMQIRQYIRKEGPQSHHKKTGTPTMGGILIIFSVCISTIVWSNLTNPLIWIAIFATIIFGIIGFIDDYIMQIRKHNNGLGVKQKLLLQVIAAIIISCLVILLPNFSTTLTIPFLRKISLDLDWMYIPFSVSLIVGTSNAVNLTDGLDGMAIGTTMIAKIVYMLLAFIAGYPTIAAWIGINYIAGSADLTIYCGAFFGAGLGFLWFNSHPAQIFMGDIGSLSIGASLGTVAILVKNEMLLILIGGIFVFEALSVILQVGFFKLTSGNRLFKMAPIHHHFELSGMPESKIVLRFWIIAIILAFISIISLKFR